MRRKQARKIARKYRSDMRRYGSYLETENFLIHDPKKITGAFIRRHLVVGAGVDSP